MASSRTKTGIAAVDKVLDEIRDSIVETKRAHMYVFGNVQLGAVATTRYLHPCYGDTAATAVEKFQVALHGGRLENLRVSVQTGADTSGTLNVRVRVNGRDTQLLVEPESKASGMFQSRPGVSIPVKAGDLIAVAVNYSPAPATAAVVVVANFELVY